MEYTSEYLSSVFREMYDISADVPVFDRAASFQQLPPKSDTGNVFTGEWFERIAPNMYWVHVANASEQWMAEIERDQGFEFPEGYNNIVDVVRTRYNTDKEDKHLVYMHYRAEAEGLPRDF